MEPFRFGLGAAIVGSMLAGGLISTPADAGGKKDPEPNREAIARAHALIKELYGEELDRASKDPAVKGQLAMKFLQEARDTTDHSAGRFVLLDLAATIASEVGDAPTAFQALDEAQAHYQLPPGGIIEGKKRILLKASNAAASPSAHQTVIDMALGALEDALGEEDFDTGRLLVIAAENAAKKLRNVPLVSSIRKKLEEVDSAEKNFARWKPFAERLRKNAKDREACLEMGKYYAFVRGNWEKGLGLVAKGNDDRLEKLAEADLGEPKDAAKQAELGAAWHKLAESYKEQARTNILLRAYGWYQQALGELGPAEAQRVEAAMSEIMEAVPAGHRIGEIAAEWKRCEVPSGPIYGGAFSPDGKKIVTGGADGALRLWDAMSGKQLRRLDGHSGRVWAVAFAPEGRRVLSGGFDGSVRLWDLATGRESRRFDGHKDYVRSVVMSNDGRWVLSGGDDRMVRLWNADTGKEEKTLNGHDHFVWCVALSRDGTKALSGSLDKTARLWDLQSGQKPLVLRGHKDTVLSVAFSPDGKKALTGSTDKTLKLWDLATGDCLQTFEGHKGYVHSVAFSPDGRRALSASQDNTVRLWDVKTGQALRTLEGHRDQVWHVAFSRDGRLALSTGQDNTLRIWGGAR